MVKFRLRLGMVIKETVKNAHFLTITKSPFTCVFLKEPSSTFAGRDKQIFLV